ncbi:hypothetical protein [Corynebacterium striatum]|uniref:hypothetical protein n=1 Tax=Corynebacterium striatum TaxID=43770 RepID=UPI0027B8F3A1|nr:hypothetical protein [Corynebacterium striatum]
MKTDARRVYVFIAIGLLSAVFVGLGVWKISAPGGLTPGKWTRRGLAMLLGSV